MGRRCGLLSNYFDLLSEYESKAQAIAKDSQYGDSSRRASKHSHRITFLEGPAPDTVLAPSDKFRVDTHLAVIDSLIAGLSHRLAAYEEIHSLFSFFAEPVSYTHLTLPTKRIV